MANALKQYLSKEQQIGNQYYKQGEYKKSISIYSKGILKLDKFWKCTTSKTYSDPTTEDGTKMVMRIRIQLRNNRAQCYRKLQKYNKALRDLNWIITPTRHHIDINADIFIGLQSKALLRRAHLFLNIGNSGAALGDYSKLILPPFNNNGIAKQNMLKLSFLFHPSPKPSIKCNKYTIKSNIFSINGWQQIKPMYYPKELPFKRAHSMISYKGALYCFGGTNNILERELEDQYIFFKIKLHVQNNKYFYSWKELEIPTEYKLLLNTHHSSWEHLVCINRWKHKLILFGGYYPFKNVFYFDLKTVKTQQWSMLNIKETGFEIPDTGNDHISATILNDKLFVYDGGCGGNNKFLYSLDLIDKIWIKMPIKTQFMPPNIDDHLTWCDPNHGKEGSIYIAYGYIKYDKDRQNEYGNSNEIWRYDVAEMSWFKHEVYGNAPFKRGESGYASNNHGLIIFGGYTELLKSSKIIYRKGTPQILQNKYVYFGDCFKFFHQTKRWKMIQSKIYPNHRAGSAMCHINNNLIILYGGYQTARNYEVFNDLWMLDLKQCKWKKDKSKICKTCKISSNEQKLYICKCCKNISYCSRLCQKLHWKRHKLKCTMRST